MVIMPAVVPNELKAYHTATPLHARAKNAPIESPGSNTNSIMENNTPNKINKIIYHIIFLF
jgi:hypothetical protein